MKWKSIPYIILALTVMALLASCAAQQGGAPQKIYGEPGSPAATMSIDGKQLPPADLEFGGVIKEEALQSKAWWAPRVVPPACAPSIIGRSFSIKAEVESPEGGAEGMIVT